MNRTLQLIRIFLIGIVIWSASARASAGELDVDQRMKILMRVLTYDRQLEARQDRGKIFVAVLFAAKDRASVAEKDAVVAALGRLKALKVKGFSLDFAAVPYSAPAALETAMGARRAAAIYVCGGLAPALGDIKQLAAKEKIATMSASEPFTQGGLAFAAFQKDGKGQIIVNLKAAKAQGLDLDASLLRLAIVLR
jgi:hypothetical protein